MFYENSRRVTLQFPFLFFYLFLYTIHDSGDVFRLKTRTYSIVILIVKFFYITKKRYVCTKKKYNILFFPKPHGIYEVEIMIYFYVWALLLHSVYFKKGVCENVNFWFNTEEYFLLTRLKKFLYSLVVSQLFSQSSMRLFTDK